MTAPAGEAAVVELSGHLESAGSFLLERLNEFLRFAPLLLLGIFILILFWALGVALTRWEAPFRPLSRNPFIRDVIRQSVRAGIFLIGALLVLELLELTTLVGAVLGAAGLMGLALGFAFRDLAENYIASILLSLRQPFLPNDHVIIEGQEGRVVRLTSRATILMTLDGNHLRIPNAAVFKAVILNYTRNPRRRFTLTIGVGVGENLARVQELGVETLRQIAGILADPAPSAIVEGFGDSNVRVRFAAWVDQTTSSFNRTRGEALRRLKEAFDEAGIGMPEPTYVVRLDQGQPPSRDTAAPPLPAAAAPDLSPETELEDEVDRDRDRGDGEDLLDPDAPKE